MWEGLLPFSNVFRGVFPVRGRDSVGTLALLLAAVGIAVAAVALAVGVAVPAVSGPFDAPAEPETDGDGPAQVNPGSVGGGTVGVGNERLLTDVARQVRSGAVNLTQDDYDQARDQFGDEQVDELIAEYRDRAGDAGAQPELLYRSQLALQNHTEQVAAYWELYALYEEATDAESGPLRAGTVASPAGVRHSPDGEISREIALELDERADRVEETAAETLQQYRALAAESNRDYAATIEAIEASHRNVTTSHQAVLREEFVETNLTLRSAGTDRVSPLAPLEARGRLVTEDGRPLANERVTLEFDPETPVGTDPLAPESGRGTVDSGPQTQYRQALTNETGWFYLEYRPTTMPLNATELTVTASPADTELIGDERTVSVTAEQIRPTLRVDPPSSEVAFNETVSITGSLSAGGVQLRNVPYRVFVDGQTVAENRTTVTGGLDTSLRLPAAADPAGAQVRVQLLTDGGVLEPVNATASLDVATTATEVSLSAQSVGDGTVRVTGQLTAAGGTPVVDQPVSVQLADQTVAFVRTDETGSFDRTVAVPEGTADDDEAVTVTAAISFDGSGTNLATATERAEVTVPPSGSILGTVVGSLRANTEVIVFAAGILLLGGAGFLLSRRWRRSSGTEQGRSVPAETAVGPDNSDAAEPVEPASLLARTVDHYEAGNRAAAVRSGYAAVRLLLDEGATQQLTHWEFYDHHRGRLDGEADTLLRRVTELYERVEFAAESVDESMVADVVAALRAFGSDRSGEELTGDLTLDRDDPSISDD
jgi:hypothetical protein